MYTRGGDNRDINPLGIWDLGEAGKRIRMVNLIIIRSSRISPSFNTVVDGVTTNERCMEHTALKYGATRLLFVSREEAKYKKRCSKQYEKREDFLRGLD